MSRLLKHRHKSLTLNQGDNSLEKVKLLIADPYFLRGLRILEIQSLVWWKWQSARPSGNRPYDASLHDDYPKREDLTEEAVHVIDMVQKAARLETVNVTVTPNPKTFDVNGEHQPWQLPGLFVEALQTTHPKARLAVWDWQRLDQRVSNLDLAEETLVRSPSLRSLSISDDYDPLKVAGFEFIVRNAPSLEMIEIRSFNRYIRCDEVRINDDSEVAGHESHNDLPNAYETERKASLKDIYVSNAETDMTFCDRMASLTRLDQLRSLTISGENARITPDFLQQAAPLLPRLVNLNLDGYISPDHSDLLTSFLLSLPILSSLTLRLCPPPLLTRRILSKHGPSLKHLRLGRLLSYETPASNLVSACLPIVHELCPNLRTLSGLACEETDPISAHQHKIIAQLSRFARFISDGVRIMVPFPGSQPRHHWSLNKSGREHVEAFHRAYELHRLIFPPDRQTTGSRILELLCGFKGSSAVWSVRPAERDDEPDTLEIAVGCAAVTAPAQWREDERIRWWKVVRGEVRGD